MSEQITYYHDPNRMSPYCSRVEIALLETGAPYKDCSVDVYNKPEWFAKVNPLTGKIPAVTYGRPNVPPEDPSPLSFKITESYVILEFIADLFPDCGLLPPLSNPTARARVRFFMDVVARNVEVATSGTGRGVPGAFEKLIEALEKIQSLLPNADAADGGEYAIGKDFTIADCAIVPWLASFELAARTDIGGFEPGTGYKLRDELASPKFDRLRRYQRALWERESVKKTVDLERMEPIWRARHPRTR